MHPSESCRKLRFLGGIAAVVGATLGAGCAGATGDEALASEQGPLSDDSSDVSSSAASPFEFQPIAPCLSERDYVRSGVVFVRGATCSPQCVRLAAGGTVVFLGGLSAQPVEPRRGGSSFSPIAPAAFGGAAEFEFADYGFFPFRCGAASGAIGVVWSTFW